MNTYNRREFLKKGAIWTGSTMLAGGLISCLPSAAKGQTGIQLYTLRDIIEQKGIETVIKSIAELGYNKVETFGYGGGQIFGMIPSAFKTLCSDHNISISSGHYLTGRHDESMKGTLVNGWEQAIEDARAMDQEHMAIAWLHPTERETLDQYKKLADMLNKAGEKCHLVGIRLAYHNHAFEFDALEFENFSDVIPYHLLLDKTDDVLVKMEMDLYWVVKAGYEPVSYFENYPGRFPLWHVKDMDKETGEFTEVGNGVIDFNSIFKARETAGLEHYFVEQDTSEDPMKSVEISYNNVTKLPGAK